MEENTNSYVVDTSVIIEKAISKLIKKKEIKGKIIVPNAIIAELEHQANLGLEIGFLGIEELQELRKLADERQMEIVILGNRPVGAQIKYAKLGEIDALIREIAYTEQATLITADKVQAETSKIFGIKVLFIESRKPKEKLEIEKFFDEHTMSVHLKEKCVPQGKKGKPGEWSLINISEEKLPTEKIQEIAKEIVEKSRMDPDSFVEISRKGSTVVQYKNYRVVIVKPPVSDGWEITAVRPLKKLNIDDYKLSEELFNRIKEKSRGIIIAGEPGSGKCHGKDTPILMYNGSIKMVQNIKQNELIMGPDSKPKTVLCTIKGHGKLYKIIPVKGDPYIVNEDHILSLKYNNHYKEKTINISVKDFLGSSRHFKGRCKGYRTKIEFAKRDVPINPYFLGLWLGDGLSASLRIASSDSEILRFLDKYALENKLMLKQHSHKPGKCQTYGITTGKRGTVINPLLSKMRKLNLINNKHIPEMYKINNREVRLQVLAGLVDTDGYLHNNCIEIATKFQELKEGILYLAKSLGFAAYCGKQKIVKNKKYYRINISGDLSLIPTKIKRKIGGRRKQVKNALRTGINVNYMGIGDYYGFELNGDGLYCLGDFTVTHNSTFAQALAEFYSSKGKITKTVESPRDLQVSENITQYSKNFTTSEEIHDILFLSRPDNIIFDEMRDTPDFQLYTDLRLAGSECIGVLHSASPIDAIQRFIPRLELGMIPSVIDTILFIEKGKISKIYSLKMVVKVPTGMTEADLSRPVVEVRDFETKKLEYEVYSYGEQTVVIPVQSESKTSAIKELASKMIEEEFRKYSRDVKVELPSDNKAVVYVQEKDIPRIIGTKGENIGRIEDTLNISIDIKELEQEKSKINFDTAQDKKHIKFFTSPGLDVDIYIDDKYIFTAIASKKGEIRINKNSKLGRDLLKAISSKKLIELRA